MEKTTKKKVRKAILGVTSVALVAGVTSALTMAMLSDTESAENTFTADPSLSLKVNENKWDNLTWKKQVDGSYEEVRGSIPEDEQGETIATSYKPGDDIPKNPNILNTSQSNEYVALRVVYQVLCTREGSHTTPGHEDEDDWGSGNWHTISVEDFKEYFGSTVEATGAAGLDGVKPITKTYDDTHFLLDDKGEPGAVKDKNTDKHYAEYYYYMNKTTGDFITLQPDKTTENVFEYVRPDADMTDYTDAATDKLMFPGDDAADKEAFETPVLYDITGKNVLIDVGNQHGLPKFRVVVQAAAIQTENLSAPAGEAPEAKTARVEKIKEALVKCFPALSRTA